MPRDRPNRAEVSEDLVLARPSGKPSVIVATRVKFGLVASHRPLSLRLQSVGTPVARHVVTSRSVTRDVRLVRRGGIGGCVRDRQGSLARLLLQLRADKGLTQENWPAGHG